MDQCKSVVAAPLVVNEKLSKNDGIEKAEATEYKSLIGSLLYLTAARPDLMYSASLLSRFKHSASLGHLATAKKSFEIFKRHNRSWDLVLKGEDLKLEGYVDSDWAGCMDDMRSTSGNVFSLASGPFSWNSMKQELACSQLVLGSNLLLKLENVTMLHHVFVTLVVEQSVMY
ncbi:hypothetical protein GH714_042448 [Hevea brasiliensis]|uniref:Reverse transcriptase Ty1/copia-type domain-containing protein n=1 Tax=Hevea brasiliensis TaxID=3981 RepID=A0A6A6M5T2_HEVBR|nr:hypothetical protein GH714_042448 [Hevea brasiliensis]